MTWSNPSSGVYKFTYTEDVAGGVTITYIDTYDSDYEITATEWSDTAGNSSSISWATASKTFDYDGDKTTSETTQTVLVESGSTSWKFTEGGTTTTNTRTFEHYYSNDGNWTHKGGFEEDQDGVKTYFKGNFQEAYQVRNLTSVTTQLDSDDGIKYELFGTAKYVAETRTGWNGLDEVETTYYNSSGVELGRSFSNVNQWTDFNGNTVSSTNTHYEEPDGTWLGNEFSDSGGSKGWNYEKQYTDGFAEAAGFDLDGDGTAGEDNTSGKEVDTYKDPSDGTTDVTIDSTNFVRVEQGQDSWSYKDMSGNTVNETRSFTFYYDKNGTHLGGVEVQDGETIKWGANWTFVGVEKDTSSLSQLSDTNAIAYKLFGAAKYDSESWLGWNGLTETETTYYDASTGAKLGSAFTNNNSWTTPDGQTVTSANTSYNDADWNYLGNEWAEGSNGGWNYEKKYTSAFDETAGLDLDGDGTAGETGITQVDYKGTKATINADNPVTVRQGQDKFSFTDMAGNTVTEDLVFEHYYDKNDNHLGGIETRNGEKTIFGADYAQGAKTKSLSGNETALNSTDHPVAYQVFGDNVVFVEDARTGWNGFPEVETTYYNSSGVELGRSMKMTNEFTNFDGTVVTSVHVNYDGSDGSFLGNERDSGTDKGFLIEKVQKVTSEPAWLDFDKDGTKGETSISPIEMVYQKGEDTWTFGTGLNAQQDTRAFEHYYTKDTFEHLGGKEVQNGETLKFGPNWTELGVSKDASSIASLPSLVDYATNGLAFTFFNTAKYDAETRSRPDGVDEIETTYYSSQGEVLGRSLQDTYSNMRDGSQVTETNIDYRGPVDEFLGRKWSDDAGNSGQDIEYQTTLTSEPTFVDFDGNGTPGESISGSGRQVRVKEEANTVNGKTTSASKYFDATTGSMLGGTSAADGYTTVIGSNGQPTGVIYDPNGNALSLSGVIKMESWTYNSTLLNDWVTANNKGSLTASEQNAQYADYLFKLVSQHFFDESVEMDSAMINGVLMGGRLEGSVYTLELLGSSPFQIENPGTPNETMTGTVVTGRILKDGVPIGVGNDVMSVPAELVGSLFQSVTASAAPDLQVDAKSGSGLIEISNSTLEAMEGYELKA